MASRCNAINDRDSRFISKDWAARRGSTGHADRYPEVGLSEALLAIPAADLKPASTSSAKRFFVAEETDAGEFHTWLWRGASLVSVV